MAPWYQFLQVLKYFLFVPITCWRAQTFGLEGRKTNIKQSFVVLIYKKVLDRCILKEQIKATTVVVYLH